MNEQNKIQLEPMAFELFLGSQAQRSSSHHHRHHVVRCGCQWRLLPREFPNWSTVCGIFRQWLRSGVWRQINASLSKLVRKCVGKKPTPTAAIVDSQSIRTAEGGVERGYDGKKITGRKRHIAVDTLGLLLTVVVHAASWQDHEGACCVLMKMQAICRRLKVIFADSAYGRNRLPEWGDATFGWVIFGPIPSRPSRRDRMFFNDNRLHNCVPGDPCNWRITVRSTIAVFAFLSLLWGPATAFSGQPNILFIFSDDHAQHAISAYGSKVNQTPHLDRLAKDGARFTNSFVTNSICTPSRATLLTGQYSHLNGVPVFNRFDGSRDHAAKFLQAGGYHTGMIGKWHLGSDPTGFDRWIVLPGQGAYRNPQFLLPGKKKLTIEGHCTDITTDLGIEWLKTRPKDKPFFLMLHQKAPHRAWEPAERHVEMFKDKTIPEPETLFDDYATRPTALPKNEQTIARDLTRRDLKLKPTEDLKGPSLQKWLDESPMELEVDGKILTGKELVQWKYQKYMRDYLGCVQGVDDGVGKVLDYLDEAGLAENTIVIYSADNGWYLGDLGLYDKRFMYEPGLHTPLIVRGPGVKKGSVPTQFVANIDLAPTFLDLAGLPVPDFMQGRSIAPLLRGDAPADWRTSIYYRYYHDPGHHNTVAHLGVRTATHKLIHFWKQDAYELFDLTADPHEQRNLLHDPAGARQPAVAAKFAELKAELAQLKQQYKDTDDLYANPRTWPEGSVDGPWNAYQPMGTKSVAEAIQATLKP